MSDIENRLRASMRFGVLDGSAEERGILGAQIKEAIWELVRLRARAEAAERERDLITSQLLMVGSEICGDPKLDPKDHRDPRWTPTLEEAAKLRAEVERLRGALEKAKGPIAIAASYADAPEVSLGLRVHARDCARILPEINAALREEAPAVKEGW